MDTRLRFGRHSGAIQNKCKYFIQYYKSLEDLALVELAALLVRTAPREVVVHQLLGVGAGGVQLAPVVGLVVDLPVGRQREGQLLAAPHPDARDGGVVVRAEQTDGGEGLLTHLVQSLEHACNTHDLRVIFIM